MYVTRSDGAWETEGIAANITTDGDRDYVPMDSEIFNPGDSGKLKYATASEMTDSIYGITSLIPISKFAELDPAVPG